MAKLGGPRDSVVKVRIMNCGTFFSWDFCVPSDDYPSEKFRLASEKERGGGGNNINCRTTCLCDTANNFRDSLKF